VLSFSHGDYALLALLLATGLLLLAASQFLRVPYPIVLVLGGTVIGFMPHAPEVHLNPDLVLVAVLPPLLYGGAFFTSLRELRANMKAIGFLAIGLCSSRCSPSQPSPTLSSPASAGRSRSCSERSSRRPIRPPPARSPSGSGCPRASSR